MIAVKCSRCGAPGATQDGYELLAGKACSICWHELNLLNLKSADRAANVDVRALNEALATRCKANGIDCGCTQCPRCEGHAFVATAYDYVFGQSVRGGHHAPSKWGECSACGGTGRDSQSCHVEAHWTLHEQLAEEAFRAVQLEAA